MRGQRCYGDAVVLIFVFSKIKDRRNGGGLILKWGGGGWGQNPLKGPGKVLHL